MDTQSGCYNAWKTAVPHGKADALGGYAPACRCQYHSLRRPPGNPVGDDEWVIRILVAPDEYDLDTGAILTNKLVALSSSGVSLIRQNAPEDEIRSTVAELTNVSGAPQPRFLVGFVRLKASSIRELEDVAKVFCIYDTEDGSKTHHADILCSLPQEASRNAIEKRKKHRRNILRELMSKHVSRVSCVERLVAMIREMEAATENTLVGVQGTLPGST